VLENKFKQQEADMDNLDRHERKVHEKNAIFTRKLRKVADDNAWIGGVCAGIAYWLGIPAWILRLL
jgi:hypothetical protein